MTIMEHVYSETPEQERALDEMQVSGMLLRVKNNKLSPEAALEEARYLKMENIQAAKDLKLFETLEALVNKNKAERVKEQRDYEAQWERDSQRAIASKRT